jgi:hypothetical protein
LKILVLGGLVVFAVLAAPGLASAQTPYLYPKPPFQPYPPHAPDACGPGFYNTNAQGAVYGPNYWLLPPWMPYNGERPSAGPKGMPSPQFPTHRFARSPRDFFMLMD